MSAKMPEKFAIGEIARIRNLESPDDIWNGSEVVVMSRAYTHPKNDMLVINVKIDEATGWAVEPWNLEKITEDEHDAYIDHRYLNPNGWSDTHQAYDGNKVVKWSDCVWQPDPNFKRDDGEYGGL
jgi:hypothetical protein